MPATAVPATAVNQVPISATAAYSVQQLQPVGPSRLPNSTAAPSLTPISSAKPAVASLVAAPVVAATAEVPLNSTGATAATANSPKATAQEPVPDIYSPIRPPPASTLAAPSFNPQAKLPAPQLNPLPLPPQLACQPPASNAGAASYATAEQIATWQQQQQQQYQGYYGGSYPYSDPAYGYAYPQMTQHQSGFGGTTSAPLGVITPQLPSVGVAAPRPPPLGPNSPPPKRPVALKGVGGAVPMSQAMPAAGLLQAALPGAFAAPVSSAPATQAALVRASADKSGEQKVLAWPCVQESAVGQFPNDHNVAIVIAVHVASPP